MNGLKFPVLHDNTLYYFILCVIFLSVRYSVLSEIHQFIEFYLLKTTERHDAWNN